MRFLFLSDYFSHKTADEAYLEQSDYLRNVGFETSVIFLEALAAGTSKLFLIPYSGERVIYRGWMSAPDDYSV